MSVVINTNSAATSAAYNLSNTNVNLQRSLNRLSSGSRINSSYDDAGGLAVSMKLSASIRRTDATLANVNNSIAFLQTQDGVIKTADKILNRMSELATLAQDVTKSTSDLALYNTELTQLKGQLNLMLDEEFNGISLFSEGVAAGGSASANGLDMDTNSTLVVVASHDGNQTIGITQVDLNQIVFDITDTASTSSYMDISTTDNARDAVGYIQTAIQNLATLRANNGAEQSRLTFAADMLAVNKTNLEAANSRILDVDVADESTKLARFNILQQAGTAMLAQANQSTQSILRLIS
ncbi:MAG: flagellin [Verrucomicrobia bacterium]|nr:flagellin [Verrucomicrobiota bacterium]